MPTGSRSAWASRARSLPPSRSPSRVPRSGSPTTRLVSPVTGDVRVLGMDHSIGAVARLAGVAVKTVRYYSDLGLLTSRRTTAGHRRYDETAVARLELIRTLRALGLDLETVRAVLERERALADVLTAHADALAVQIRTLQAQHAVVSVATHSTPEELTDMT